MPSKGEPGTEWTSPPPEEVVAFFKGLGIKHHHDLDAEIAALPDGDLKRGWQEAEALPRSIDDAMAYAYQHADAIGILVGSDFHKIVAVAALLTGLPSLAPGAKVLDVGGGPGHLALWMVRCWPAVQVTVLDRLASSVSRDWTPMLPSSGIRFVDGDVPSNLTALAGERFDRIVVARMIAQGARPSDDLRSRARKLVKTLTPLVADGGDLVVIDHFHDRDEQMQQSLAGTAKKMGFSHTIKGWRLDPHDPWALRFVNAPSAE